MGQRQIHKQGKTGTQIEIRRLDITQGSLHPTKTINVTGHDKS